jgi:hypothetical protein
MIGGRREEGGNSRYQTSKKQVMRHSSHSKHPLHWTSGLCLLQLESVELSISVLGGLRLEIKEIQCGS